MARSRSGSTDPTTTRPWRAIFKTTFGFAGGGAQLTGVHAAGGGNVQMGRELFRRPHQRARSPTRCGDASETVTLTKAQPVISTEASPETALGGQISDSATLIDGSDPTAEIRFDVYGPDEPAVRALRRTRRRSTFQREQHLQLRSVHTGVDRHIPVGRGLPATATTTRQARAVAIWRGRRRVQTAARTPRSRLDRLARRSRRPPRARHRSPHRRLRSNRHDQLPRLRSPQSRLQAPLAGFRS